MNLNSKSLKNLDSGIEQTNAFIKYSHCIVELGELIGCKIIPYASLQLPIFSEISDSKKYEVICRMKFFVETCEATLEAGNDLDDSKSLTWFALKKLNLRFPSEMFQLVSDDDLIELYDRDNIQVFRNFNFMAIVSYTLEDFFCRPWTELFERKEPEKAQEIIRVAQDFYSGKLSKIQNLEWMGVHNINEADSALMYRYEFIVKRLCPIKDSAKMPYGFLAIEGATLLNQKTDKEFGELFEKHYFKKKPQAISMSPELNIVRTEVDAPK